jgi:hypothetical protein
MTAVSKAWVTLTDAATDVDSPVDQALVQGLRDDTVHLREWLGASYTAGAAQDHNHDGVNSAIVEVGPNALRNGSFEQGLTSWTATAYAGGTAAPNAANMDGAACAAITSTVLANGGGELISSEYITCAEGRAYGLSALAKASVAGVSAQIDVYWYNAAKGLISTTSAYFSASVPLTATQVGAIVSAPTNARYMRVRLTGGIPNTGTAVGTVYFDGCVLGALAARHGAGTAYLYPAGAPTYMSAATGNVYVEFFNAKIIKSGTLRIAFDTTFIGGNPSHAARVYKNGVAYGPVHNFNNSAANSFADDLDFVAGDTVQVYANDLSSGALVGLGNFRIGTAVADLVAVNYSIGVR